MKLPVTIGLIGDRDDAVTAHRAIPPALDRAAAGHAETTPGAGRAAAAQATVSG
jgi:hypothetical protein